MTEDLGPTLVTNGGFETGNLTGWSASAATVHTEFVGLGGELGNYAADLGSTATTDSLSQFISTTPGQHYTVSFVVLGDTKATSNQLNVTWDGATILAQSPSEVSPDTRSMSSATPRRARRRFGGFLTRWRPHGGEPAPPRPRGRLSSGC
jgi:hypothetical protein